MKVLNLNSQSKTADDLEKTITKQQTHSGYLPTIFVILEPSLSPVIESKIINLSN